jgi:hypothetical protein
VTRRLRVRTEQSERPVGEDRAGAPGLLPVEHPAAVDLRGSTADGRQIAPCARLGPRLRPDVVTVGHARQDPLLLLLGAELEDGRREQEDAVLADSPRGCDPVVLLLEDQPLDERSGLAAVLLGPRDDSPTAGVQLVLPGAMGLEAVLGIE